jgi:GNAT superfamily N-acetyltransferase
MKDVLIRPARPEDADTIADLIASVASRFVLHEFPTRGQAAFLRDHTPDLIAQRIEANFRFHVAESAGEIVGVVALRDGAHLYDLFVAEAFHGRGLGRALWERAKAEALANGNPGEFSVSSSRYAVPVYERFGFVATGPVQERDGVQFVPMRLAP